MFSVSSNKWLKPQIQLILLIPNLKLLLLFKIYKFIEFKELT